MAAVSKGYSIMPMDKFIKENSKMGSGMAKEWWNMWQKSWTKNSNPFGSTLGNGGKIKEMAEASFNQKKL